MKMNGEKTPVWFNSGLALGVGCDRRFAHFWMVLFERKKG